MLHLLLVEDQSTDVLLVREALRQCDIPADVVIAHDGEHALNILGEQDFKPDFILLDLNLPKIHGLQLLERFQENAATAPVIVLTSSANPDHRQMALELGAREYFTKPSNFDVLRRTICGIVSRWSTGKSSTADAAN